MSRYIVLLRGVNVGGKNSVSMAKLCTLLDSAGYDQIKSYINSGNLLLNSGKSPAQVAKDIESIIVKNFQIDSDLIKVLVLTKHQLQEIITHKPSGFGDQPDVYHSDVIFLINTPVEEALAAFSPKPGVDTIWPGRGVIYSQRLSSQRTQSRLNKIMSSPFYKSMTIRNWNTTLKLLDLVKTFPPYLHQQ